MKQEQRRDLLEGKRQREETLQASVLPQVQSTAECGLLCPEISPCCTGRFPLLFGHLLS